MPHTETLLPRSALFNTSLNAIPALVYTLTLFILEVLRPGQHIFDVEGEWLPRFTIVSLLSFPLLVFGSLILIAVRIGARSRRRRRRSNRKSSASKPSKPSKSSLSSKPTKSSLSSSTATPPPRPPPIIRPPAIHQDPLSVSVEAEGLSPFPSSPSANTHVLHRRRRRRRQRTGIPRGYVSVTSVQKGFAVAGFLWMLAGLVCTSVCAAFVFFGQRERYNLIESRGVPRESVGRRLLLPLATGILPAAVFAVLSLMALGRAWMVARLKGKIVVTPAASENGGKDVRDVMEDEEEEEDMEVQVVFGTGEKALPVEVQGVEDERRERLLRQLRDMGFQGRERNLDALEKGGWELERARDWLEEDEYVRRGRE